MIAFTLQWPIVISNSERPPPLASSSSYCSFYSSSSSPHPPPPNPHPQHRRCRHHHHPPDLPPSPLPSNSPQSSSTTQGPQSLCRAGSQARSAFPSQRKPEGTRDEQHQVKRFSTSSSRFRIASSRLSARGDRAQGSCRPKSLSSAHRPRLSFQVLPSVGRSKVSGARTRQQPATLAWKSSKLPFKASAQTG